MAKQLHERLATALTNNRARSADLQALVKDVEAERKRVARDMALETSDSINLGLSDEDRDAAALRAERARRDILALGAALDKLQAKISIRIPVETRQAAEEQRASILAERDAIAERFRSEWPGIEARIVELLSAVVANDAQMKAAGIYEANGEALARGVPGNFALGGIPIRQISQMALPAFANGHELAWPAPARGPNWSDRVAENAARQRENHRRSEAAEAAAWSEYEVSAGTVGRITEVKGKARNGAIHKVTVYPASMDVPGRFVGSSQRIWLHERNLAALRRAGLKVELAAPLPSAEPDAQPIPVSWSETL